MHLTPDEVQHVLAQPEITYPSPPHHGPDRWISVGGRLAIVHDQARHGHHRAVARSADERPRRRCVTPTVNGIVGFAGNARSSPRRIERWRWNRSFAGRRPSSGGSSSTDDEFFIDLLMFDIPTDRFSALRAPRLTTDSRRRETRSDDRRAFGARSAPRRPLEAWALGRRRRVAQADAHDDARSVDLSPSRAR